MTIRRPHAASHLPTRSSPLRYVMSASDLPDHAAKHIARSMSPMRKTPSAPLSQSRTGLVVRTRSPSPSPSPSYSPRSPSPSPPPPIIDPALQERAQSWRDIDEDYDDDGDESVTGEVREAKLCGEERRDCSARERGVPACGQDATARVHDGAVWSSEL